MPPRKRRNDAPGSRQSLIDTLQALFETPCSPRDSVYRPQSSRESRRIPIATQNADSQTLAARMIPHDTRGKLPNRACRRVRDVCTLESFAASPTLKLLFARYLCVTCAEFGENLGGTKNSNFHQRNEKVIFGCGDRI
jgi:hypothetical protein